MINYKINLVKTSNLKKDKYEMPILKKHTDELNRLKELGFITNPYNKIAKNLEQVWQIKKDLESKKESLNYPIDGLVIKLNDNELVTNLGVVGKTNRAWCAIKFAPEEAVTKLVSIDWQVGRTGKLTPVANLEPVNLQGTIVKRATLHNYKQVVDMDLKLGDMLIIAKAGDIIPEVVKVIRVES